MSILIWLLIAVIAVILLVKQPVRRPPKTSDFTANLTDHTYNQGFTDALDQVKQLLNSNLTEADRLKLESQLDQLMPAQVDQPANKAAFETTTAFEDIDPVDSLNSSQSTKQLKVDDSAHTLNIILFVASLLMVASMASLIASFGSAATKLIVVWAVAALFFTAGLGLYRLVKRLRPAALAFVGIGMVLVPLAGMLMFTSGLMSGIEAAIVTSSVAVALYLIAAVSLKNELVAAVSVLALVALVISLSRGFEAPYVLVFSLIISVAIAIQAIEAIFKGALPKYYFRPLSYSGRLLPAVAIVASLPYAYSLSLLDYEILVALMTLQYGLYFWRTRLYGFELVMRAGLALIIILLAVDIANRMNYDSLYTTGIGWVLAATLTVAYGLYRYRHYRQSEKRIEQISFVAMSLIWWSTVLAWSARQDHQLLSIEVLVLVIILSIWARVTMKLSAIMYQVVAAIIVIVLFSLTMFEAPTYLAVLSYSLLALGFGGLFWTQSTSQPKKYLATGMAASVLISLIGALSIGADSWWTSLSLILVALAAAVIFIKLRLVGFMYTSVAFLWLSLGSAIYCLLDGLVPASSSLTVAAVLVGMIVYSLRQWLVKTANLVNQYSQAMLTISLIMLAIGSLAMLATYDDNIGLRLLHGISSLLFAAICGLEYLRQKISLNGELAIYALATGVMQTIWIVDVNHNVSWLVYLHIIVAAIYSAAAIYSHDAVAKLKRLKLATITLTVFLGMAALTGGSLYQVLFMIEHIIILMLAVLFSQKWLRTWSAIALTLGLMYSLRDIPYIFLMSIGIGLIIYVLWRLSRQPTK